MRIYTIGHSNRPLEALLELLRAHAIEALADVRRYPRSRRWPHFNEPSLRAALRSGAAPGRGAAPGEFRAAPEPKSTAPAPLEYHAFSDLGGFRDALPDSRNDAWENDSFRGYADYMETAEFLSAAQRLIDLARTRRTALMCAEADWRNCHRGLLSDWLNCAGVQTLHIVDANAPTPHVYTKPARLVDGRLSYRAARTPTLFDLGA